VTVSFDSTSASTSTQTRARSRAGTDHPGRVMLVFSRAADARDVARWLTDALDMDLTVVRDFRVAQSLLLAAGPGRFRAVIAESDLRGGTGLELLSRAKSLDGAVTTLLVSRFATEALDMHEMFFVDHHVPAGLPGERLCDEVLRALGMSPGVARGLPRAVAAREVMHPAPLAPAAMTGRPAFAELAVREVAHSPVPPPMGPVTWGNELGSGLWRVRSAR
jgi:hypothetical protein